MPLRSREHFCYGLERAKSFVNVHLHCIVSNMERIRKISRLPPPWKSFCGRPCFWLEVFSNFWHFSDVFWLFLTCKCNKQKIFELWKFLSTISLQYSKSRDLKPFRPRRDLKPWRLAKMGLETETKSRDSIAVCMDYILDFLDPDSCWLQQEQEWGFFAVTGLGFDFVFAEKTLMVLFVWFAFTPSQTGIALFVSALVGTGLGADSDSIFTKQAWLRSHKNQTPYTSVPYLFQCCADIEIWWSDPIRKISVVSESDPDPKSMLKT